MSITQKTIGSNIKQSTIEKTLQYLKEVQKLIYMNNYKSSDFVALARKHHVVSTTFYNAVHVGVFKRISEGKYSCDVRELSPIHARMTIQRSNDRAAVSYKNAHDKKTKKPAPIAGPREQAVPVQSPLTTQTGGGDDFKELFINSIVSRFRESLKSKTAKELQDIHDTIFHLIA